jgi:hypothetical protein
MIHNSKISGAASNDNGGDINLVEIWLRKDPKRWVAGVLAGVAASLVALVFAIILGKAFGHEPTYPIKVFALFSMGPKATEFGTTAAIPLGLITLLGFGGFWGAVYAHFTGTNKMSSLLLMGLVWGAFLWIFWFTLFFFSSTSFLWAWVSPAGTLPIAMIYGICLCSVGTFDQMLRR